MKLAILSTVVCLTTGAQAQPAGSLKDARIALRLDSGRLLIVGGSIAKKSGENLYDRSMEALPREPGQSALQPVEEIFRVPAEYMTQFRIDPETRWRVGARWTVYTAAGAPLRVVIESISFGYYCGGTGGYATAVARFENPAIANVVAGLRAGAYLAAPAPGLAGVSERPMTPTDQYDEAGIPASLNEVLLRHARSIVGNDDWKADWPGAREINHTFLNSDSLKCERHLHQWQLPGSKPLLFAETIWRDEKGSAVFGANAVLDLAAAMTILAFDTTPGEQMRLREFSGDWERREPGAFRNAWAIGSRRFVLTANYGYEGFWVELMELVPGKGFTPTGIFFSAGC